MAQLDSESSDPTGPVLDALAEHDLTRKTHYDWLQRDPEYEEAFHEAEENAADVLEAEARRRAVEGVDEPVGFYKGEASQYVRRYSDGLLKFLLEGRRRRGFGRRTELTGPGGEGPAVVVTKIERVIVDCADERERRDGVRRGDSPDK